MVLFYSNFHVVYVNNIRTEIIMWSNRGSVGGILGCGSGSELGCHLSWAFLHLRGLQKWFLWLMSSEMVLMSYVFRNGSYVLYLQKWFLCLMSSEMVLMSYVQFPCGMCENKNAKHHRIRGWHIGLWQRKLVGVPSWLGSSHLIRPGRAIRRQMLTASSVISTPAQNKQKYR